MKTHWLDDKINEQNAAIGNTITIEKEGLQANVNDNREVFESFMEQLNFLFDKLSTVITEEIVFNREAISVHDVIGCERSRFDAVNKSQSTIFMRRIDFLICDKPGEVVFELYRAKRTTESEPWKFHDEQKIICKIDKLNESTTYDMIDWFAWKNFFPRTLRKD